MAGEANNLASHQGPEPNILNRKQLNFNVQMNIFPLKIKSNKVECSRQTTVREANSRMILLTLQKSSVLERVLCLYVTQKLKYHCWQQAHLVNVVVPSGNVQHTSPEMSDFSAFNPKPSCRFWFSIASRGLLLSQNGKITAKAK